MSNTFTYNRVVDISGGTAGATLELDKWYAISEDGRAYIGPCRYTTDVIDKILEMTISGEYDITFTLEPHLFGNEADTYVCTGQQFKDLYEGNK